MESSETLNVAFLIELVFFLTVFVSSIVGNYMIIRNTQGPREHRFMVRASCAAWTTILAFFLLGYLIPSPWRYLLLVPYFLHLPVATYLTVNKQLLIRKIEEVEARGVKWST